MQRAAQHVRKQLDRVEQLLPVTEDAANQAIAATQIASSAIHANPKLNTHKSTPEGMRLLDLCTAYGNHHVHRMQADKPVYISPPLATGLQSAQVRQALRALVGVGDKSAKAMASRMSDLQETCDELNSILEALKKLGPTGSARSREHGLLTPGTMASPNLYEDNVLENLTQPIPADQDENTSMIEMVHLAHARVKAAQELCKVSVEQVRSVRSSLINTRGQVHAAQTKLASETLLRERRTSAFISPSTKRRVPDNDMIPFVQPVTAGVPRWPRSSSPQQATMTKVQHSRMRF